MTRAAVLALPKATPMGYGLGKSGWVSIRFEPSEGPPRDTIKRWVMESYRVQAPSGCCERSKRHNPGSPRARCRADRRATGELRGSYATFDGKDLWIGTWTKEQRSARMFRLDPRLFEDHDGQTVSEDRGWNRSRCRSCTGTKRCKAVAVQSRTGPMHRYEAPEAHIHWIQAFESSPRRQLTRGVSPVPHFVPPKRPTDARSAQLSDPQSRGSLPVCC